jgi:hypothetical protein
MVDKREGVSGLTLILLAVTLIYRNKKREGRTDRDIEDETERKKETKGSICVKRCVGKGN